LFTDVFGLYWGKKTSKNNGLKDLMAFQVNSGAYGKSNPDALFIALFCSTPLVKECLPYVIESHQTLRMA